MTKACPRFALKKQRFISSSTYRVFVPIDATFVSITVVSNEKPEKSSGLAMKCLASTTPHASLPCVPPVMKTRLIIAEPWPEVAFVRAIAS